jgi:hypothetical protein
MNDFEALAVTGWKVNAKEKDAETLWDLRMF